jgi:hypothetical protein
MSKSPFPYAYKAIIDFAVFTMGQDLYIIYRQKMFTILRKGI